MRTKILTIVGGALAALLLLPSISAAHARFPLGFMTAAQQISLAAGGPTQMPAVQPAAATAAASTRQWTIDGRAVVGTLDLTATAYAPTLQDNYPYGAVDYFGRPLVAGDVAVDPRVIPLGTLLWVTGYNSPNLPSGGFLARAVDTGNAIQGDRLDIFINGSEATVSNFGIQHVTAYVLQ